MGTFLAGPLSDTFGRKPVMIFGAGLYIAASVVAWASTSLELMLVARAVQGLGASGPRVVAMAVTRDLFSGREMARIVSFIMMVFALVPGFAPAMGVGIISVMGWRGIYVAFVIFSFFTVIWMVLRLPETLPEENRRPLSITAIFSAARYIFGLPVVRLSIVVQTLSMAVLISMLMLVQQIYSETYGRADTFAYWFGATALISASASWINAVLVVRLGMRRLVTFALGAQILLSSVLLGFGLTTLPEPYGFAVFVLWQISLFLQAGLTLGNLNAIGMEPLGHVAGIAASIIGGVSTMFAALMAAPVVLLFDGTVMPLAMFVVTLSLAGFGLMLMLARVETRQKTFRRR
ncbi:MFS transporter [Sulfitobacter aestuariivivens]|uniref:MFS transporter n=1 Tax=Sulfitobacter aestuariivivens TaxID=2766981 RepID=UPI003615EFDC